MKKYVHNEKSKDWIVLIAIRIWYYNISYALACTESMGATDVSGLSPWVCVIHTISSFSHPRLCSAEL